MTDINNISPTTKNSTSQIILFFIFFLMYFVVLIAIKTFFGIPSGILLVIVIPGIISFILTYFIKILLIKISRTSEKFENNIKPRNKKILSIFLYGILIIIILGILPVFRGNAVATFNWFLSLLH